jgi:hypothetical protein
MVHCTPGIAFAPAPFSSSDIGTEVGEVLAHLRADQRVREVDDATIVEGGPSAAAS